MLQKTMAEQSSHNMDEGTTHANSVNKGSGSDGDVYEPEEDNPGLPHGVDRSARVQMTHKEATNKLNTLVKEMMALMQAHGLPTDKYMCGASFCVSWSAMRPRSVRSICNTSLWWCEIPPTGCVNVCGIPFLPVAGGLCHLSSGHVAAVLDVCPSYSSVIRSMYLYTQTPGYTRGIYREPSAGQARV